MTRKQIRTLVFAEVNKFNTTLAKVYFENLEGDAVKGDSWIRASLRFGSGTGSALGTSFTVGVIFIQIFYRKNVGGSGKDEIVENLVNLFDYKTLTDSNGYVQFRGGTEVLAPDDGEYHQAQYSIPFGHYKEIA